MRNAAAEGAAVADRVMRNVTDHLGKERAEGAGANAPLKRRVTNARADDQPAIADGERGELFDVIDINEMGGPGEPEGHGRNQALTAGQHAAVLRTKFSESRQRLGERLRRVIAERGGLHGSACNRGNVPIL
jgi:hypothetical protein